MDTRTSRTVPYLWHYCITLALLVPAASNGADTSSLSSPGPVFTIDAQRHVTVRSTVNFSELDGGPADLDGVANGVLEVVSLTVESSGTIVVDVADASIVTEKTFRLKAQGSVVALKLLPSPPVLRVHAGHDVDLEHGSTLSLDSPSAGGVIELCADRDIIVSGAVVSASASDGEGVAGRVRMNARRRIKIERISAQVRANGGNGGSIRLIACNNPTGNLERELDEERATPTILINGGQLQAMGMENSGGSVELQSRDGAISIRGSSDRILATGVTADGSITLVASTVVDVDAEHMQPLPVVIEHSPSDTPCTCDFGECEAPDCEENEAGCADCNFNGVPDACDIESLVSSDVDGDGVPDECAGFIGGCGTDNRWSCVNNWNLGGTFPNNSGGASFHVTLDDLDDVFLDLDVIIDSLTLVENSRLIVTQTGMGDLVIIVGGLLLDGELVIGAGRLISLAGQPWVIGPGGLYHSPPSRGTFTGAGDVVAGDTTLLPGSPCPPTCPALEGGTIELSGEMTMTLDGSLTLDGTTATECNAGRRRGGVSPPPKLSTAEVADLTITEDFTVIGSVNFHHSSAVNMTIDGDFVNLGVSAACFDWSQSGVRMSGDSPQQFEVAGRDLGITQGGFATETDTNFSMGMLEVASGSDVSVNNALRNLVGSGPCEEALYVRELRLELGATLTVNDCRIYAETLTDLGATLQFVGCGELIDMETCSADGECIDWDVCTIDSCTSETGICDRVPATPFPQGDINDSGTVDLDDILCVLGAFAGNDVEGCILERSDLIPCGVGTGDIDLDDILETLAAFSGTATCPDPCPA